MPLSPRLSLILPGRMWIILCFHRIHQLVLHVHHELEELYYVLQGEGAVTAASGRSVAEDSVH